jgi:hypothetical protein
MGTKTEIDTLRDKVSSIEQKSTSDKYETEFNNEKKIVNTILSLSKNNTYYAGRYYTALYWGTMAEGVHCYMLIFRINDTNYIDTVSVNPGYDPSYIRIFQKKYSDCINNCTRFIRRYSSNVSIMTQTDYTMFNFNVQSVRCKERIIVRVFNLYHKGKIYEKKVECNLNRCHKYYTMNLSEQEKSDFNIEKEHYISSRKKDIVNIVMYYYSIIDNHYKAMFQLADYIFEASFNTGCPLGRKMFDFRLEQDGLTYELS